MDDAQQNGNAAPDTGNVMDLFETFNGLADNATAAIGTGVSKIGAAGAGLADKAGTLAGDISDEYFGDTQSLGEEETASGIAGVYWRQRFARCRCGSYLCPRPVRRLIMAGADHGGPSVGGPVSAGLLTDYLQ